MAGRQSNVSSGKAPQEVGSRGRVRSSACEPGKRHISKRTQTQAKGTEAARVAKVKKLAGAESGPPQQCLGRWFKVQDAASATASAPCAATSEASTILGDGGAEASGMAQRASGACLNDERRTAAIPSPVALAASTDLAAPVASAPCGATSKATAILCHGGGEASAMVQGASDTCLHNKGRAAASTAASVAVAASIDLSASVASACSLRHQEQSEVAGIQASAAKQSADRVKRSGRFDGSFHGVWWQQYNDIYKLRLDQLRDPVEREARNRWGATLSTQRFLPSLAAYVKASGGSDVVLIGIIRKEMKSRPSVLQCDQRGRDFATTVSENLCSVSDTVWLEDCSMCLRLELHPALTSRLATGLVVAVRGRASASDIFHTSDLCLACVPEPHQPELALIARCPRSLRAGYVAFLSGLAFGQASQALAAARKHAFDFLLGHYKTQCYKHRPLSVQHVVICGGLFDCEAMAARSKDALNEADAMLAQLASTVSVDVMPGRSDPSNLSLPQMPLCKHLFPRLGACDAITFVSNPVEFSVDGMQFLGHSGQPVEDILRCLHLPRSKEVALEALGTCLEGLHLAPTAPDTLETRPFCTMDPFVIDKVPHVLFSGSHSEAASCWRSSSSGAGGTQCICIPAFSLQPAVVLVNLSDPKDIVVVQDFENPAYCTDAGSVKDS
eukprot:TRINITY_DN91015_c0_g1_i1.p1 TRINITY_DN91015_c0_g1~~TRINITY_DN91015_c0_g1_i1.p1  ORF type:complete len:673 (+),score=125.28 TRINITY_DN91015_c0_g1_i1:131-2149(+)